MRSSVLILAAVASVVSVGCGSGRSTPDYSAAVAGERTAGVASSAGSAPADATPTPSPTPSPSPTPEAVAPADFPRFDPDAVAEAELRMWQAYYQMNPMALGREQVALLRSQFGLTQPQAMAIAAPLTQAAVLFAREGAGHPAVLPGIEAAYVQLGQVLGREWDAAALARQELDWWQARRTPGRRGIIPVGASIAELYRLLTGRDNELIRRAANLRAQAAQLRDQRGLRAPGPGWDEVGATLRDSYRLLYRGLGFEAEASAGTAAPAGSG